jgi:hypothetical protein
MRNAGYGVLFSDPERRRSPAVLPSVHGFQALPDPFNGFNAVNAVQQFLIRCCILDDQCSFPIDRQDLRPSGLLQALHMFFGVPLKICERVSIIDVHHTRHRMK